MKKIINPWAHKPGYKCFGCCPNNPIGLKMCFEEDGSDVVCRWKSSDYYQGWVDTLHGGIQATLIDECASWVVFRRLQTTAVTVNLSVKYRKAIMTTEPDITIRATLKETKRNLAFITVRITNSSGELCAEGDVTYFLFPKEKAVQMGFTECLLDESQEPQSVNSRCSSRETDTSPMREILT